MHLCSQRDPTFGWTKISAESTDKFIYSAVHEFIKFSGPKHIYLSLHSWETNRNHAEEYNPLHLYQSGMPSVLPFDMH